MTAISYQTLFLPTPYSFHYTVYHFHSCIGDFLLEYTSGPDDLLVVHGIMVLVVNSLPTVKIGFFTYRYRGPLINNKKMAKRKGKNNKFRLHWNKITVGFPPR